MHSEPLELNHQNVREANMGDLEALQTLDEACFSYAWGRPEFADVLKSRGATVILVVEHAGRIIGYAAYTRIPKRSMALVLRMAVLAEYRRRKIGSQLLQFIRKELDARTTFKMYVQENDLVAQMFLRANKFTYLQTHPNYFIFGEEVEHGYEFVFGATPVKRAAPTLKSTGGPLTVDLRNRFKWRGKRADDDTEAA